MRYLSVCSGIEAASVAWHPLGWEAAAFSEIEAFPRAVLAHHYPQVPCHGDFTTIGADDYGAIDVLVGGTPCQSFSVAGLRGGLGDDRGNLALEYLRLADRKRPRWLVWENVPGVLSSNGGRDFGSILGGMVELGYHGSYRVLDAQHFGVPQRRRRVFVVGHLGDWRRSAAVLFERHSLSGHPAPRREKGQGVAGTFKACAGSGGWSNSIDHAAAGYMIPSTGDTSHCLNAGGMGRQDYETETLIAHSLRAEGFDASEDGTGRGTPLVPVAYSITPSNSNKDYNAREVERSQALTAGGNRPSARGGDLIAFTAKDHGADASDISPTLRSGSHSGSHANGGVLPAVAFNFQAGGDHTTSLPLETEMTPTLQVAQQVAVHQSSAVRRLTPRECERLQGFPDDYTLVPYRGKPAADGPRYKALGNSMAVPVMRWIGERIAMVEALQVQREAA